MFLATQIENEDKIKEIDIRRWYNWKHEPFSFLNLA